MDTTVSLPVPQPVAFFGFRTGIKGNVHFLNDHEILYPAGSVLVIHHLIHNTQKYIKPADHHRSIKEIVLSPNRKVVGVTSQGDKTSIALYDVVSMKRKKTLVLPEASNAHPDAGPAATSSPATEFVTFTFTHDSKAILAVSGEPDWMLYYFNWEKGKLESSCKATVPGNPGTVTQVVAHPNDATSCILVGPSLFRMMAVAETVWRQFGWQKADQLNICCAVHLAPERILAGTKDGRLVVVENNDLKRIIKAWDMKELDPKALEVQSSSSNLSVMEPGPTPSGDREIRCLVPFLRGFLFAQGPGTIFLFEADNNMVYRRKSILVVPLLDIENLFDHDLTTIRWISVNPSMERMVVATDRTQLYTSRLWKEEIKNQEGKVSLEILGPPLHHGPIVGLAMCQWKPIFMTVGKVDRTVRLWNYETETQDFAKQYLEDIYCIALHPTGFYVALGFCDKLRYLTISIDDLIQTREFPIRSCTVCAFSNNGHLFAATNGNIVQIFSTLSYQNMYNLRGHFGRITKITWTPFDLKLVSCGLEGAVYEWDIATSERVNEVITKTCGYTDVVVTADGRSSYAVGTDGLIKELNDSEILRQVPVGDGSKLDAIAFSRSNLMLFVAGMEGVLFSVKFPLSEPNIYQEYMMHSGDITGMGLTWDDRMIISISEDGSVCLWKLTRTEGKAVPMDKDFTHCKEILINRKDLSDKMNAIKELNIRLVELETEHTYQVKQMETHHEEQIAQMQTNYLNVVDELKETNEAIEAEHSAELNKMANNAAEMKHKHEQDTQELEANYFQKLIVEYNKYTNLDQRLIRTREDYEKQLEALQESKEKALQSQEERYQQQLRDKTADYDELLRQYEKEREESEGMRLQIEDDADREIVTLRVSFESSLREERDNNVKLRSEVGILKKKLIGSQREVDELRLEITQLQNEQTQFQKAVHTLERDSSDLKKDVQERDSILQQKERTIADLKRQTQELDKYRFVLNYKINELKSQIEPKDLEIKEKKEQIQDMEQEIEKLQNAKDIVQLHLDECREKYNASEVELQAERKKHQNTYRALRRIWIDFHGTSSLIQHPKELREALKVLYQKYSGNPSLFLSKVQDTEAQCEFMRQREHLEKTVASLKRQVLKGSLSQHGDHDKIMEHNIALMKELNSLRTQLKKCHHAQQILDQIMAAPGARAGDHQNLQKRLVKIIQEQEDVGVHGARRIRDLQKMVDALTEEVQRLSALLAQSEEGDKSLRSPQTT